MKPGEELCHVCSSKGVVSAMKEGTALENTYTQYADFFDTTTGTVKHYGMGCTMSKDGPAKMVNVWKCPTCGHSITK